MKENYLELKILVSALFRAVNNDKKFFSSILFYVDRINEILNQNQPESNIEEMKILIRKIEEFYSQWRPSGSSEGVFYIPPRQTSDTDKTVQEIYQLINKLETKEVSNSQ